MPTKTECQEKAFQFLKEKFESQTRFKESEFKTATGFSNVSFQTYLSKQFKGLLLPAGDGYFRVSGILRLFRTWKQFQDKVVSQNRNFGRRYRHLPFDQVVIFEFYLPLRNEEYLRETLDALFYRDSVLLRLKSIEIRNLREHCPFAESDEERFLGKVCDFVSEKFGGYSVNHVAGRFRAGPLRLRRDVLSGSSIAPDRYIVDETTAVVKFIIPCADGIRPGAPTKSEPEMVRWLFEQLFVGSILEVVNAEDEIWLLESGLQHRLHIWRAQD